MTFMQREWEPKEGYIPALSIAQPYATGIIKRKKKIELRPWGTHYRGPIALHAGKTWYGGIKPSNVTEIQMKPIKRFAQKYGLPAHVSDYPTGAIIGVARLVRCATFTKEGYERLRDQHCSDCDWTPGEYGWQFEEVQDLPELISARGYLGLFPVPVCHCCSMPVSMEGSEEIAHGENSYRLCFDCIK